MKTAEIRQKFLDYFEARGHAVRPSSSLVPADDPTLLFTNAGMVQFKKVFLGLEDVPFERAVTSQKCVRAGGKHNDLEEVGESARHQTFFEMLGNFSFGDYFKRDAIAYAWEFLTKELGIDPDRLYVTVHDTDDEAAALWVEVAGIPAERIFALGDKDNFWQMADTGPCGPCSEVHYDMRPEEDRSRVPGLEEFVEAGDRGEFIELWNLVFMQFNRDGDGVMHPLPAPSIDTGAGLERLAAVLQGSDSNYHTDIFEPLLASAAKIVQRDYDPEGPEGVGYRVLADHARAVAFLLADDVYPSNEGRGYVLRRILRRGVRHAWLMGRREPTLVGVVETVIDTMGEVFPELTERRDHLLSITRAEEERFLTTIEGGMHRFDQVAPTDATEDARVISGDDAFRLYDTFGFPLDLTQLMARERGFTVDTYAFEAALETQRERSRADRAASDLSVPSDELKAGWGWRDEDRRQTFVGYEDHTVETDVIAVQEHENRTGVILRQNPFYLEGGGQISDVGVVDGGEWSLAVDAVDEVHGAGEHHAVAGILTGEMPQDRVLRVRASVDADLRRNTQRNHTATHLMHAALRNVLGEHVAQRGSLVAPDRLRFDFAHTAPLSEEEKQRVVDEVNRGIWSDHVVEIRQMAHADAVARGAMALFGEKYGEVVRVVEIPGVSMELCGGTHVSHTGEIGLFEVVSESGVAAGVRRIEAVTGPGALEHFKAIEDRLLEAAAVLRTVPQNVVGRAEQLAREKGDLEGLLEELRKGGGAGETVVHEEEILGPDGVSVMYRGIRLKASDPSDAREWGDAFLKSASGTVAVVAVEFPGGRQSLFTFVSDDLISHGIRADELVRQIAQVVGGRGGGRPHMAQAGIEDPEKVEEALREGARGVRALLGEKA